MPNSNLTYSIWGSKTARETARGTGQETGNGSFGAQHARNGAARYKACRAANGTAQGPKRNRVHKVRIRADVVEVHCQTHRGAPKGPHQHR